MPDFLSPESLKTIEDVLETIKLPQLNSIPKEDIRVSIYTEDGKLAEMLDQTTSMFLVGARGIVRVLLKEVAKYQDALQEQSTTVVPQPTFDEITERKFEEMTINFKSCVTLIKELTARFNDLEVAKAESPVPEA